MICKYHAVHQELSYVRYHVHHATATALDRPATLFLLVRMTIHIISRPVIAIVHVLKYDSSRS